MPGPRADIAALQAEIHAAGLDVAVAMSGENFTYVNVHYRARTALQ